MSNDTDKQALTPAEVQRLVQQLAGLRAGGVHALRSWMDATDQGLGGRLVLQAPSKPNGPGHLPEAAYQSQFWTSLLTGDAPRP